LAGKEIHQGDVHRAHEKGSSTRVPNHINREFIRIYLPHLSATSAEAVHACDLGPTFGAVSSSKGRRTLQLLVSAAQWVAKQVSMEKSMRIT